jgi:hypothetical protein
VLTCPDNSASKCVGEAPAHEQFRRGPQPVKGANLVGIGSPQGGHLGRWSGAVERRNLTLRNFCGRQISTTGAPTTNQCLHIWIGGFQDQARAGLFVLPCGVLWASGACGSVLKGYHGRPLFFPWSVPVPETRFSVDLGRVLVLSACGWWVRQVAPVFPPCGGPLALSESSFSAPYPSGRGDLSGEFPLSGEVFPSDTACYAWGRRRRRRR